MDEDVREVIFGRGGLCYFDDLSDLLCVEIESDEIFFLDVR